MLTGRDAAHKHLFSKKTPQSPTKRLKDETATQTRLIQKDRFMASFRAILGAIKTGVNNNQHNPTPIY